MTEENKLSTPIGLKITIGLVFLIALASIIFLSLPTLIIKLLSILSLVGFILIGVGLVKLKNVARTVLIIIFGLLIIADIITVVLGYSQVNFTMIGRTIIEVIVIVYLFKPNIKKLFH